MFFVILGKIQHFSLTEEQDWQANTHRLCASRDPSYLISRLKARNFKITFHEIESNSHGYLTFKQL